MKHTTLLVAGLLVASGLARADYQFPGDIRPAHTPVGHNYGWATDAGDVLVNGWGDKAATWKDVDVEPFGQATLYVAVDDGFILWVNGQLVADLQWAAQGTSYWNYGIDVTAALQPGRNRITFMVYNVCQGGGGEGGLDYSLVVDGYTVLPAGSWYPFHPANELHYSGGDCSWMPLDDAQGRFFTDRDYGLAPDVVAADDQPQAFRLAPAFPNPFNPATTLEYSLAATGAARLSVHDLAGREVALLADGLQEAGAHQVVFDAAALPSGVYFARLEANGRVATQKLLLVK